MTIRSLVCPECGGPRSVQIDGVCDWCGVFLVGVTPPAAQPVYAFGSPYPEVYLDTTYVFSTSSSNFWLGAPR